MVNLYNDVLDLMKGQISPLNARSVLQKAAIRVGLPEGSLDASQVGRLVQALAPGCALFLGEKAENLLNQIASLGSGGDKDRVVRVNVANEGDLATARRAALDECAASGASLFASQRFVTMVSELTRNMVSYSHGGHIVFAPAKSAITVVAEDRGPGIADLDTILQGRYVSKTGMGMGILGVKRLASKFDITTSPSGTRIEATIEW